ncbi:hypothetical protein [Phenylobacterium sp.]|uniref:hypothetical protein n=1 Tax=Phenylobacterium sp. TaxID=1871053 RepID=UPI0035ADF850
MRVEYAISGAASGWLVKRGHTAGLRFATLDQALTAAQNMAQAASERGETAVVTLASDGGAEELRRFAPRST